MSFPRLIFAATFLLEVSYGIPHDYCFSHLNKSDCAKAPIPVFTYYQEGSRCEVEFWRGCPTKNKFADEIECSAACIGDVHFEIFSSEENEIDNDIKPKDPCQENLNLPSCKEDKNITVFTYNTIDGKCIEDTWTGCPTLNKFDTEEECKNLCTTEKPFAEKLKVIEIHDAEHINDILDEVHGTTTHVPKPEEHVTTVAPESSEEETTETAGEVVEVVAD